MEDQVYRVYDSIELALETGESHFREFKSALEGPEGSKKLRPVKNICKNISKTLVAFANADGGELIIGIEDDSSVTGIPHKDIDIQKMLKAYRTHVHTTTPLPEVKHIKIEYKEKILLYFQTSKSTETIHLTSEGLCLQRRDRESVPIAPHTISFGRQEVVSRQFDREFIPNASIADLDLSLVEDVATSIINGLSPERCLQHLDLAEYTPQGLKLRRAALLLFASDISKWHSRSQVRFIKVIGNELLTGDNYNAQDVGLAAIPGEVLNCAIA